MLVDYGGEVGDYIAFYGTLRNYKDRPDKGDHLEYVGMGIIPGQIFQTGWFPAFVKGDGDVTVEVYKVLKKEVYHNLDSYEGALSPQPLYTREKIRVGMMDEAGDKKRLLKTIESWVYVFARPVTSYKLIKSGDWFDRGDPNSYDVV